MRQVLRGAFTLVELVIVIAIVGILAAIAIPRFIDIRSNAFTSQRDSIVGSVRAGILTVAAKNQVTSSSTLTFPPNLEVTWAGMTGGASIQADGTDCGSTACFRLVVPGGYEDANWTLTDDDGLSTSANTTDYDFSAMGGGVTGSFTYTAADGTFR